MIMKKSKAILSLMIGTIALSVLSLSFSLAWYASSDRLLVNTIDIDLRGEAHLLISTSPEKETFKESLETEELNSVKEFIPTSSMYQSRWMNNKSDTPVFYDTSSDIALEGIPKLQTTSSGFYQQKIYLLSDINYYATLSGVDSLFKSDETANSLRAQALTSEIKDLTEEEIETKLNNLVNSLRVSILVPDEEYYRYYIVDPTKKENEITYYAGLLDNNADGYYDTYSERDENDNLVEKEIIYGEIDNRDQVKYNDPTSDTLSPTNQEFDKFTHRFFGNSFEGKSKETAYTFNKEQSKEAGVVFKEEPSISLEELEGYNSPLLIPCYRGQVREIVVSIYLEGWDEDCYNSTMGASFISTLSFKLLRGI